MTLSATQDKVTYQGNGATTAFTIPMNFGSTGVITPLDNFVEAWLKETAVTPATEVKLILNVDYTISGTTLTATIAPTATQKLLIKRLIPLTQLQAYLQNVGFPIKDHEAALDKLTLATQYLFEIITRAPKLPNATAITDLALPEPQGGELLAWNAAGNGLMNVVPTNLGFLVALLAQDSQAIVNSQAAQAPITNMSFDGTLITSVEVHYEIARTTGSNNIFTNGLLYLRYRNGAWEAEDGLTVGDLSGISFSIITTGSVGQVNYTSSNIAGVGYTGKIKWRNITFS